MVLVAGVLAGVASFQLWGSALAPPATTPAAVVEAEPPITASTTTTSSTTTSTSTTTTTTLPPRGWLVIHGTGDVAVDPDYIPALAQHGWDHAWSGLDGLFIEDDLTVINLECVPSDLGLPLDKAFVFRCPTQALPSIRDNGIEVANLANNHSGDYGKEALVDGRDNLIEVGIAPVGAGRDAAEAGEPALFRVEGWTVAVVGFGGVVPSPSWLATDDTPGMRDGDDIPSMVEAVAAAAEAADIVVVTIHWGVELDTSPRPDDVERAEAMIAAGADVVFGHHPHRLQPLEMIDDAAVFWSLGNFVWPKLSEPSATTAVARAVIDPQGNVTACLIPAYIESHGRPVLTAEPPCAPGEVGPG